MQFRTDPLVSDHYYHIFNRSIAKFVIFNDAEDFERFVELITLYQHTDFTHKYSAFKKLGLVNQKAIIDSLGNNYLVEIVAYCLMPTHIHLLLKQVADNGITKFTAKILNSYTRYFNARYHRKGPLWEGHFRSVLVKTDEQLLHLTRYIHLNSSSAGITDNPFEWPYSSLKEYTDNKNTGICYFKDIIDLDTGRYKKFVLDQKDYQKSISLIKHLITENYSG